MSIGPTSPSERAGLGSSGFGSHSARTIMQLTRLDTFKKWLHRIQRPGCEWLRSYEVDAIIAFYLFLDQSEKEKLLGQFERVDFQQRSSTGILLQLFDSLDSVRMNWPDSIRISRDGLFVGYKFKLEGKPGSQFIVFLARGGLAEIQFKRPPKSFQAKSARVRGIREILLSIDPLSPPVQFEAGGLLTTAEGEALESTLFAIENDD